MARIQRGFKFRSGFEDKVQKNLKERNIPYVYEGFKIHYTVPSSKHIYTPDIVINRKDGSILYVECKGLFDLDDRKKLILVKEQYPDLDLRILFMRNQPIRKGSKTMYSNWAEKNDYIYAIGVEIPESWINE